MIKHAKKIVFSSIVTLLLSAGFVQAAQFAQDQVGVPSADEIVSSSPDEQPMGLPCCISEDR